MKLHVFPVSTRGLKVARRVASGLGKAGFSDAVVYAPKELKHGALKRLAGRVFNKETGPRALVFVSAAQICVRSIAPYLKGKDTDPPVVVVDELARFVVSVLSGHLGGANALTRKVAEITGATAVVTTATDLYGLACIEDVAKRFSFAIGGVRGIKVVNSAVLNGGRVVVVDSNASRLGSMKREFGGSGVFRFQKTMPKSLKRGVPLVVVTSRAGVKSPSGCRPALILRPREFVLGVGTRRGVTIKEVERACMGVLRERDISPMSVRNLATIDIKKSESGLLGFSKKSGWPVEYFSAKELGGVSAPSGYSKVVERNVGVGAVAEPAALVSAGAKRIWVRKRIKGRVTVAVARVCFT